MEEIKTKTKLVKVQEGEGKGKQVAVPESYGNICIKSKDNDEVKSWQLGEIREMTVMIKVTSLRTPDRWDIENGADPNDITADFAILGIGSSKTKNKGK